MINKVIFFIDFPFDERDYDRFGIKILQENELNTEIWDFSPILHPEIYQRDKSFLRIARSGYYLFLNTDAALNAILKLHKNEVFIICLIPYNINSYKIYRTLSKNELKYCVFMANALPVPGRNNGNRFSIIRLFGKLRKITGKKLVMFLYSNFCRFRMRIGIKPATAILAGGEKSIYYNYPIGPKTEILWLHTLDYDIYLREKEQPTQVDERLGVFLDEYLPFHPDYAYIGLSPFATPDKYYSIVCNFFDFLERRYGVRIIVAAHPRSNYESLPDYFSRRPVIKGKTAELVRKSKFVITHASTAINFVILFKKPLIFITTDELKKSKEGPLIETIAALLNKKPIDISAPLKIDFGKELQIDEQAYERYKNDYIKKNGSEEKPFWRLFADYIKSIK